MIKDMRERKCGCVVFEVGPPVLCPKHQSKATKKAEREKAKEEKGLRKVVAQQALDNGHDLSPFKEYSSCEGKWVAHCHSCGALVIVYDRIPERGDQVSGAVFRSCNPSALVGSLAAADREAIAARFKGADAGGSAVADAGGPAVADASELSL